MYIYRNGKTFTIYYREEKSRLQRPMDKARCHFYFLKIHISQKDMHRNVSQMVVGLWLIKNAFMYKKTFIYTHINLHTHTRTGCYCLVTQSCPTLLWPQGLSSTRLLCPWDFPGKNTGVGCHFLLQGIFLSQGLNLGVLHFRWMLYWPSY